MLRSNGKSLGNHVVSIYGYLPLADVTVPLYGATTVT